MNAMFRQRQTVLSAMLHSLLYAWDVIWQHKYNLMAPVSYDQLSWHSQLSPSSVVISVLSHSPSLVTECGQTFLRSCCCVFFGGEGWKLTARLMSFLVKAMCASPAPSVLWAAVSHAVCGGDGCLCVKEILFNSLAPLWYSAESAVLSGGFHVVHFFGRLSVEIPVLLIIGSYSLPLTAQALRLMLSLKLSLPWLYITVLRENKQGNEAEIKQIRHFFFLFPRHFNSSCFEAQVVL